MHVDDEVFVNTIGTYVDPAAPSAAPTEARRSAVVHPAGPTARGDAADEGDEGDEGDAADEGDEGDEAAADEGAADEAVADDAAADEAATVEEDAEEEGDDEHPAETATTVPTAITPRARSSRDAKPAITNHSFCDPVTS